MSKKLIIIYILLLNYALVHAQNIISVEPIYDTITKHDSIKASFVIGEKIDTLFIDFGEIKHGELKHAVVKITSLNDSCFSNTPNSKTFINDKYRNW